MAKDDMHEVHLQRSWDGLPMGVLNLWILRRHPDGSRHLLRPGGLWEPMPNVATSPGPEPTLKVPEDALGLLREEVEHAMTGIRPATIGAAEARTEVLAEALAVERLRVDRVLDSARAHAFPLDGRPPE